MKEKTVLITGANRGLGLGFTRAFLEKGYSVFSTCREPSKASELQNLREHFTDRLWIGEMDVTSSESCRRAFELISKETDHLDILLNNAGVYGQSRGVAFQDLKPEDLLTTFQVNTLGALNATQSFIPLLLNGNLKRLVQISSLMGSIEDNTSGGSYGYRLSKAALNMLSRNFAWEFKDKGVISVVLHPGWVKTDMGGKDAPLEIDRSVGAMLDLIENLKLEDSGKFLNYRGRVAPY